MLKKKNIISRLWLKYTDKFGYKDYLWSLTNYKNLQQHNFLTGSSRLNSIDKIKDLCRNTNTINFMHSGNAGDIIYALPTIKKIEEITGAKMNLYFRLNQPMDLPIYNNHPMGKVMLNQGMAQMLVPLIKKQAYIQNCNIYINERIDIDLDYFRYGLIPLDRGNIARWCGYITGVSPDLWKRWITVKPNIVYSGYIVVSRSGRYQNKTISYSFLQKYSKVVFIGLEEEYKGFKAYYPGIQRAYFNNFQEMAEIISGCKVFIGNQSFPFAVAEGLKVPRILELSLEVTNVIPEGEFGFDFLFQEHLESLVRDLYGN